MAYGHAMSPATASNRAVTLIVADGEQLLGMIGPFNVETPWWQDTEPISRRFPDLAVLRLLDVRAPAGATSGGAIRYLAERLDPTRATSKSGLGPIPSDVVLGGDPLRMPWARPAVQARISSGSRRSSPSPVDRCSVDPGTSLRSGRCQRPTGTCG